MKAETLSRKVREILGTEIAFIANDSFVGRRDTQELSEFAQAVESGTDPMKRLAAGLPAHLGRMCATPLLTSEQESELFQRMNFCRYRANALRSRLRINAPNAERIVEVEDYLARAERIRNYLVQANTRLVMSIARRFADPRNNFDDLLSQGIASLMHSVDKFDYGRGYRFSTYATCAVRRDLYRMVMSAKKDRQRFSTGSGEYLDGCERAADPNTELSEAAWKQLRGAIAQMMQHLDEREQLIVAARFGLDDSAKKASYSRLGERLGISKERVRQLANRAMEKLRELAPEHRLEGLLS
ncbi:sigma-70 family RNA polymerase sigma factor [Botrimarina hoheduenensis]|uniref:sigma-70 family RNA polymerase sigma factor n=1 Tax=Botrimarina hoheduenensis TaxID=2528000 RepID=UPI0018D355A2|nr:sigma-70 family RNA polymerase sigma factor [Botrimarina hoheduenensis]